MPRRRSRRRGGRRTKKHHRRRRRRRARGRGRTKKHWMHKKVTKRMPWAGWGRVAPRGRARTVMLRKCGKKCFLGPRKSFPICSKGTCKVNPKGVYAALIRAREWGKKRSSYKSKSKMVTQRWKGRLRRVRMKGSRPRHRRRVYTGVARRANALLRKLGVKRGGNLTRRYEVDVVTGGGRRRRRSRSRRRRRR